MRRRKLMENGEPLFRVDDRDELHEKELMGGPVWTRQQTFRMADPERPWARVRVAYASIDDGGDEYCSGTSLHAVCHVVTIDYLDGPGDDAASLDRFEYDSEEDSFYDQEYAIAACRSAISRFDFDSDVDWGFVEIQEAWRAARQAERRAALQADR